MVFQLTFIPASTAREVLPGPYCLGPGPMGPALAVARLLGGAGNDGYAGGRHGQLTIVQSYTIGGQYDAGICRH